MENPKSIFDLPEEFLVQLFTHLSRSDLLNVRLVCRKFCCIASQKSVLNISYEYSMTLTEFGELLECPLILKSVSKLKLMKELENIWLTEDHIKPIYFICCELKELCLFGLTIGREISINDLPQSLRVLELNRVTFECDDGDFFLCDRKDWTPNLQELRLVSTDVSCFGILRCFASSLKSLLLKDIDNFSKLHFSQLKWELRELTSLQIDSSCDIDEDVLKTARSFRKLKRLKLGDSNTKVTRWRISGFTDMSELHDLETIEIQNLEMCEDIGEIPILPSLSYARICFASVDYIPKFCLQITTTFPVLNCLYLSTEITTDLPFSALVSLASHQSLAELYLGGFHILPLDSVDLVTEKHSSRVHTLGLWNCIATHEAAISISDYFPKVIDLWIYFCNNSPAVFHIVGMLPQMKRLVSVKFLGPGITDSFLDAVVRSIPSNVEGLYLGDEYYESAITNHSLRTVALNVPGLTALTIMSSNITFNGLFELCKLKHLVKFDLKSPHITEEQLKNIRELLSVVKLC